MQTYEDITPESRRAREKAHVRLPTGISRQTLFYDPYPIFARTAAGAYIEDVDGRRYLDFVNNYTSLIHGHAHEPTMEAISAAIKDSSAPGAPTMMELEMAEELVARYPGIEWLRFAISGSEAVGLALRAARAYTGRSRILKFEGGFHGCFDDVQLSIGSAPMEPGSFSDGVPVSDGIARVGTLVGIYNDLDSVDAVFSAHGHELAAAIVEPFLGNGALIRAEDGFLRRLEEQCRRSGTLLVLDEIQSCRLSYGGAQSSYDVEPDISTLGKTIGGGMPLAAIGARREVMQVFDGGEPRVVQTGTFTAFPPSLAAGLATLAAWDRPAIEALNTKGLKLRDAIADSFARYGIRAHLNGEGSMFNISFSETPVTSYRALAAADRKALSQLQLGLLKRGVYLTARGTGCLSTAMTDADLEAFLDALNDTLPSLSGR